MSSYYNNDEFKGMVNQGNALSKENFSITSTPNKEERMMIQDDLIIDDNTVYEIDQDCFERVKKYRIAQSKMGIRNK